MNETVISLKSELAPHFWGEFKSKQSHQIDLGGRGSTKTSKNALKIAYHLIGETSCSAIVLRKYQNTLRNSVYKEIKRGLSRLGMQDGVDYKASVSPMEIALNNGNKIYFAGGDDYEKIKGMIDENNPIKIVWFEELTEFSNEEDLQQIIATFSRGNDDWFITLYSYNPPKNKYDWVNQWLEKMRLRPDVIVNESDYRTVPIDWLGKRFIEEAEILKKYDEKRYKWIYLGEVIGIEGLIYNPDLINYKSEQMFVEENLRVIYMDFAVDGGHQTSATTCLAFGYCTDGNWYLMDAYYYSPHEKGKKKAPSELSQDIFNFEVAMLKKYQTAIDKETIDNAEGALRNQLFKDYGKRFNPVNKGKNKLEMIDFSQDFISKGKFYVLDNINNQIFKKELLNYMWKKDSVEKGKAEPDKTERPIPSNGLYFNTHSNDYSYYYADHTLDAFQYWVIDNKQKLGLKY